MQHQGTASSSCPHICWINKEIFPKKRGVHWQMITAAGERYVYMDACDHTSSGGARTHTHTPVSPLQEGEESIVEGLLGLCLSPLPLLAAGFPNPFTCFYDVCRISKKTRSFVAFFSQTGTRRCIHPRRVAVFEDASQVWKKIKSKAITPHGVVPLSRAL